LSAINERQWQGRVLQWTSELLKSYPDLPFSKVDQEFEVLVAGNTRRFNDLTLFDKQVRCQDTLHRAGQPLGERVCRIIQWQDAG
jgi:hypothetical protein